MPLKITQPLILLITCFFFVVPVTSATELNTLPIDSSSLSEQDKMHNPLKKEASCEVIRDINLVGESAADFQSIFILLRRGPSS